MGYIFYAVLRVASIKNLEIFPCGVFLSCIVDEMFVEVLLFQEISPTMKICLI